MKPLKSNVMRVLSFDGFGNPLGEFFSSARKELSDLLLHSIADVAGNNLWKVFYDRD